MGVKMYFTLKLIRFFLRLFIKLVLFPFKLVRRLLNASQTDNQLDSVSNADVTPHQSEDTPNTTEVDDVASDDSGSAAQNITRFRTGLLAIGAVQTFMFVIAVVGTDGLGALVSGAFILVATIVAFPLILGVVLPRAPSKVWYIAMGTIGISIIISVVTFPVGIISMTIYGIIGYLGYTGRAALDTVYGSGISNSWKAERPSPSTDATPSSLTAETERDTADTSSTVVESTDEPVATPSSLTAETERDTADTSSTVVESANEPVATETPSESAGSERATRSATVAGGTQSTDALDESDTTADGPVSASGPIESPPPDFESSVPDDLTAPDPTTRVAAIRELVDAAGSRSSPPQEVVDVLVKQLDDDDPTVRMAACEALGQLEAERSKSSLRDCRIDPDPDVSRTASRALRTIETNES